MDFFSVKICIFNFSCHLGKSTWNTQVPFAFVFFSEIKKKDADRNLFTRLSTKDAFLSFLYPNYEKLLLQQKLTFYNVNAFFCKNTTVFTKINTST